MKHSRFTRTDDSEERLLSTIEHGGKHGASDKDLRHFSLPLCVLPRPRELSKLLYLKVLSLPAVLEFLSTESASQWRDFGHH